MKQKRTLGTPRLLGIVWPFIAVVLFQALLGGVSLYVLSAVKQADRVLVFDGGHIAEDGDHQQLIADGGLYAKLYGHLQQVR